MANLQLTKKLSGWFDVRQYKANTPKENQKIKGNDENITFGVTFDTCPQEFQKYAKTYTNKDGDQRYRVAFKINGNCKWYDKEAKPMARPDNADLDGKRWEAVIQYKQVDPKDPSDDKAARGYWVNAIQIEDPDTNPFTAFSDLTADNVAAGVITTEETNGDLPY